LLEGALGHPWLGVDEEEDLEADAAYAIARSATQCIEELAQSVKVEVVSEEQCIL
jgi:hypothetical protein